MEFVEEKISISRTYHDDFMIDAGWMAVAMIELFVARPPKMRGEKELLHLIAREPARRSL